MGFSGLLSFLEDVFLIDIAEKGEKADWAIVGR